MKERTARPTIVAAALLLCRVEPAPCAAEPPAVANANANANAPALAPGTTIPMPRTRRAALPPPPALQSTVSPEIDRFVRQSGRDLPQATPPPAGIARQGPGVPALPAMPSPPDRPPGSGGPPTTLPSPLATKVSLDAAPFEPTDLRFPINLATALRLSDARPLIVAAAQAKVWVAEAELTQAKVLWIPALTIAIDYLRHDGGGPDFNKGILTAPSTNFFYGGGGLNLIVAATDAIYQPLVARQVLNARQWDIQSAKNDVLLQTTDAYFMVHQYRGTYAGALYTIARGRELVARIESLGRDLVPRYEADRARNLVADLEQEAAMARQQWRVQSARLTKVLRLDPRAVVEPLEHDHLQITLIDPARVLDDLMPLALTNRPELASRRALVEAAETGIRREKARPLLPLVVLGGFQSPGGMMIQGGIFALGPNSSLNQWAGRDDVSIQLMWQLQNLGFGNLALIKTQRGLQSRAIVDLRKTQDMVVEQVNRALANLQSAAARVSQADRSVRAGIIAYNGSMEGLKQTSRFGDVLVLIGRPQEAVYALQLLKVAFNEYFLTIAEYNRAQFELFHALGYPAAEITARQTPGEILPVDTSRPAYLPPVGTGPPPSTR